MNWRILYSLRSYIRSSLWVVPFIAIPFELVITRLVHGLDNWLGWNLLGFAVPGAQALLQAIVTSTLSFVVFTFGSLLVAIQVASAQMTPRIIATTLLRNNVVRYTVGLAAAATIRKTATPTATAFCCPDAGMFAIINGKSCSSF
jgi:uncharacterized membrane protein